jgi:hypothetical protein
LPPKFDQTENSERSATNDRRPCVESGYQIFFALSSTAELKLDRFTYATRMRRQRAIAGKRSGNPVAAQLAAPVPGANGERIKPQNTQKSRKFEYRFRVVRVFPG